MKRKSTRIGARVCMVLVGAMANSWAAAIMEVIVFFTLVICFSE
jgi:hypothetical protein